MKKVLLASTALVLSAGVAAADVSVGGDGRMGVIDAYDGFGLTPTDAGFTSRIRISFSASGETDGGLSFGGSIRADNSGGGASGTAGSVFVEGSFGKISMGDVSGAAEAAVGDLSGVGLTGLEDFNEMTYLSNSDRPAARYEISTGDLTFYASADNPGAAGDPATSLAVAYSMGDISVALGYEDAAGIDHVIGGVTASFGDATVKAIYGTASDINFDQYGVSLDYVAGPTTFTVFHVTRELGVLESSDYGIGVAYDLGGGASLKGGMSDGDARSDAAFDFGISMSF